MSSGPANASFYADFSGLAALKRDAVKEDPQALRAAAKQFEALFTQMMLKSMRAANFGDSMFESKDTEFYRDMYDQQLAVEMSKGKGMGLADMLVRQLSRTGLSKPGAVDGQTDAAGAVKGSAHGTIADSTTVNSQPSTAADATASAAWPPSSPADFVRQLWPHAEAAGRELGVDPTTLIAHAALETGWGKKIPQSTDGQCSFNLFGIKTGSQWNGASVGVTTLEYENGVASKRVDRFRAYDSPADCLKDYASLIKQNGRYVKALGAGSDAAAFATALQQSGYATDPNYAGKLTTVAHQLNTWVANTLKSAPAVPMTSGGGGM
jgi:flagellar protein FlgJ